MKPITMEEWLSELNRVSEVAGQDGATMNELAEAAGCGSEAMRKRVTKAIKAGEWEHVNVIRTTITGSKMRIAGYRPKKKAKAK